MYAVDCVVLLLHQKGFFFAPQPKSVSTAQFHSLHGGQPTGSDVGAVGGSQVLKDHPAALHPDPAVLPADAVGIAWKEEVAVMRIRAETKTGGT